ncbi:MAG: DUF3285 domain-containing protein [Candidatus Parcubacteria bacterium]|jgi:hypothetical protein|uniref:DUF3285 domain-containing protein n=1 Tax=Phormidesmis priestleyi TaxID=268141 RepID=UPI00083AFC3D|nr:DUF3285 domain-containing protein [Phormidesmis priestleyi]MBC7822637.1 DUF3285 domain-containing protein [Leptolyngbyaceae cyanobacterium LF-bin-113]MCY7276071.1 DUF3285 domain-containing protein [Phormidesmis sp. CAN_BIN44]
MSNPSPISEIPAESPVSDSKEKKPSYVKLAMRNMVRKRGTSIYHFALTTIGLLTALVGLAYITR